VTVDDRKRVILLVEDDELTAAAWSVVLRLDGFEVIWAPDGASAWTLARNGRLGLLLTDWNMAGIDGPELCRIFREDPILATVPIILASSLSSPAPMTPVLHDLFLQKPTDVSALLAAVSGFIVAKGVVDHLQGDSDSVGSGQKV
jgi:DNA-binding response OmpR family regulator